MDWFKGKFTGKAHIYWENLWFPVDFPLNQSIDTWVWVYIGGTMVIVEMDQHLEF